MSISQAPPEQVIIFFVTVLAISLNYLCFCVGKSFLIERITQEFSHQIGTQVCATTGLASINIKGNTIHSFAGFGTGEGKLSDVVEGVMKKPWLIKRWRGIQTLIIDEISMLSADLFDKLNAIAKATRKCDLPFGGIQLILCGDFHQLPPVIKFLPLPPLKTTPIKQESTTTSPTNSSAKTTFTSTTMPAQQQQQQQQRQPKIEEIKEHAQEMKHENQNKKEEEKRFAFEANSWKECVDVEIVLDHIFRQKDQAFIQLLAEMRSGKCSDKSIRMLKDRVGKKHDTSDGIEPTVLYPHRKSVEDINYEKLNELKGEKHKYYARDEGENEHYRGIMSRNCNAPDRLVLKVGAQVMLLKNLDVPNGLCNGSRGVVTAFQHFSDSPTEPHPQMNKQNNYNNYNNNNNNNYNCNYNQNNNNNNHNNYNHNNYNNNNGNINNNNVDHGKWYPVVKFVSGQEMMIEEEKWELTMGGKVVAKRTQIPLMLAWALTIHKAQGMTLDRATLSLEKCFEYGQCYVAVSRLRSLDGLCLESFDPERVISHPDVIRFYASLSGTARTRIPSKEQFDKVIHEKEANGTKKTVSKKRKTRPIFDDSDDSDSDDVVEIRPAKKQKLS